MRKVFMDDSGRCTVTIQGTLSPCRAGDQVPFLQGSDRTPTTAPDWAVAFKALPNGNIRFFDKDGVSLETHRPDGVVSRGYNFVENSLALERVG